MRMNKMMMKYSPDTGSGAPAEAPAEEMVTVKDPVTGEELQFPKKYQIFLGHVMSFNRNAKNSNYEEIIEGLTHERDTLLQENKGLQEKIQNGDATIDERIKNITAEHQKEIEKIIEERDGIKSQFEETIENNKRMIIDNALMKAISNKGIVNEDDFIALMKNKGNVDIKDRFDITTGEPTGEKTVIMNLDLPDEKGNMSKVEMEVDQAIDKYLSLEKNSFWVESKLKSGGGGKNAVTEEPSSGNGKFQTGASGSVMDALQHAPAK